MHKSVLLDEAICYLKIGKDKKYIDATFGLGGHSKEIVKRGGQVLGIEADRDTWEKVSKDLNSSKINVICGNFKSLKQIANKNGFSKVDGILFDLGISSWQIEESKRGFSYLRDEDLDMRFNPGEQEETAADLIRTLNCEHLSTLIAKYGEEEKAEELAKIIIQERKKRPIKSTKRLREIIYENFSYLPKPRQINMLSRTFQALRIAVNDELNNLKEGIRQAIDLLDSSGRLVIISFHSLEDRIVKFSLRDKQLLVLTKKPILSKFEELELNIRARSAKLRAAQKI